MPLISDSIGRVLGKRYRLVSALGTGASAHVFLAEDVSLQRRVAVKVLQPGLAHDESFLKRFRAEARSVASLNHPNILRVFDWGEDADGPYLVLEYLHGGSLRDVLDRQFRLSHAQAARIGAEAAQGLAYAHARGLVHRDVKPANMLFDEEGRVRIADFGVARALAEAAWTEPAGAMVGTARYASPEQAEGHPVDGRADVYSLGLVLYESLTGEVPFVTDTTVGTLMARVGATLPRHPGLGPLDDVLARATASTVEDRIDAARMGALLEAVGASLPPAATLPIRIDERPTRVAPTGAPGGDARDLTAVVPGLVGGPGRPDETAAVPSPPGPSSPERPTSGSGASGLAASGLAASGLAASGLAASGLAASGPPGSGPAGSRTPGSGPFDVEAVERAEAAARSATTTVGGAGDGAAADAAAWAGVSAAAGSAPGEPPSIRQRNRRKWPWIVGVVVLAAAVAAGLLIAAHEQAFTPSHPVPSLDGQTLAAAHQAATADHFTLAVGDAVYSTTVAAGTVVSQQPAPKTTLKEGSVVHVVPSKGLPSEQIPSLAGGLTCDTAVRLLAEAHFKATCPALLAYTTTVPSGQIINWSYDGKLNATVAPYGSTVAVAVSKGKKPVPIPTVAGAASYTAAATTIKAAGLTATQVQAYSTTVPAGQVIGTTPAAGTTEPPGTTVTVQVSKGPQMIPVPDVTKDTTDAATAALQQAGLTVGQIYGPAKGKVFTTVPLAGQLVTKGTAVNLYTQ
jgi:beta-lactam-binding protein with PASTA domain/tRNA A-37 threonylcarbamoyl transferase component Bud32